MGPESYQQNAIQVRFDCGHLRPMITRRPLLDGEILWCPTCDRDRLVIRISHASLAVIQHARNKTGHPAAPPRTGGSGRRSA